MTVGETIRRIREERRLTQIEVAREAGVSDAWLSKVENNLTQTPSPKMLRAIARPLRINPDALLAAAGYLVDPIPVEKMTRNDIHDQIDRLMNELRRRDAARREDVASGRRLLHAVAGATA